MKSKKFVRVNRLYTVLDINNQTKKKQLKELYLGYLKLDKTAIRVVI